VLPEDDDSSSDRAEAVGAPLPAVAARRPASAPDEVRDLAEACVRFVERALGVRLDYSPETLPLLDHYLEQARESAIARPETVPLLVQSAGAYLGEVVRRQHASTWRLDPADPSLHRLELEQVYLAFTPAELVREALYGGPVEGESGGGDDEGAGDASSLTGIEVDDEDREAIAARLAELPAVTDREFYAPSTRLEVIDIAVDAMLARRIAAGEPALALRPSDYN
jgi:hypothetical protein